MRIDLMRDPAMALRPFEKPEDVRHLRIWFCKYKSLKSIAALGNLEELVIAGFPDTDLSVLESLKSLRYLQILHLPKIHGIESLAALKQLRTISLATSPSWDSSARTQAIRSLAPLIEVPTLEHIELFGVVPEEDGLEPLRKCANLRSARFSKYPRAEVAKFHRDTGIADDHVPASTFS